MDLVNGWVQVFLGVLTIVTAAGAGIGAVSVKELRARVGDLRGEIEDKDRRLSQTERDLEAEKAERRAQDIKIKALQETVRGDEQLQEIRSQGIRHHAAAVEHWQEEEQLLRRILVSIERTRP